MLLVLFGTVFMIFPLSLYGLFVGWLNYRRRPTIVPGPWDFAGLLFGLSGFLLFAGPVTLSGFDQEWRAVWTHTDLKTVNRALASSSVFWNSLFVLYFFNVVFAAAGALALRRGTLSVYNLRLDQFRTAFAAVARRLRLRWRGVGNRLFIDHPMTTAARLPAHAPVVLAAGAAGETAPGGTADVGAVGNGAGVTDPTAGPTGPFAPGTAAAEDGGSDPDVPSSLELHLDPFPAMGHLTLTWRTGLSHPVRADIEAELARELEAVDNDPTPACGWIASVSVSLFSLVFFTIVLMIVAMAFRVH